MHGLKFVFGDLHPDAAALPGDIDWLLRFVAGSFDVRADGMLVIEEPEFPVLDLARALEGWLTADFTARRRFDYEVPGGAPGTLTIRAAPNGWNVDSVLRAAPDLIPPLLSDQAVMSGVRSFVDELAVETERLYQYDVRGLLQRVMTDARS